MKKIFILTGEASGDKLASRVIEIIKKNSNLIIDTRGRFTPSENIFRA